MTSTRPKGYVTSFERTLSEKEVWDLSDKSVKNFDLLALQLLEKVNLITSMSPSGRMSNKGNIALSFENVDQSTKFGSYLLAKTSKRICNILYIIEVVAEVESRVELSPGAASSQNISDQATQPVGKLPVTLRFNLYDPLSSFVLQTAGPLVLEAGLAGRREQVASAINRLHIVSSDEGRAAMLRYGEMSTSVSEAPHSAPSGSQTHPVHLTLGLSCREGNSTPLLFVYGCRDSGKSSRLGEGSQSLFLPLVPLPELGSSVTTLQYLRDGDTCTDFHELIASISHLCLVLRPERGVEKGALFEW
eukprot:CAMPEP_0114332692 /NCGR_PEP_ID=MMETSP0101-20121206/3260_1 /TAXON_ID=38822 ORGANISM="Pteridomonas danica, Strain PT" /NCGR_SAMPLE_ID=MMETSP0101 /ASSEMBLY_ACC=CAM_ASM_000211 /LENGTH=303 /DNA_ID=CAMNT_0001463467 /DNA_START=143 /DNA_END=1051 /DNA_ORIENTATION=+